MKDSEKHPAELKEALDSLPHGMSFRFIDILTALDPGKSACGEYQVKGDEAFLEGHFPDNPMMPGVILIEAIAQLAGIVLQTDPETETSHDLRLTAVDRARILGAVVPGETIQIKTEFTARMGNLGVLNGTVHCGDQLLAQARVTLSG